MKSVKILMSAVSRSLYKRVAISTIVSGPLLSLHLINAGRQA
jgi:hypothetical protein